MPKGLPLNLALEMTDRQFAVFVFGVNLKPLTDDGNTYNECSQYDYDSHVWC